MACAVQPEVVDANARVAEPRSPAGPAVRARLVEVAQEEALGLDRLAHGSRLEVAVLGCRAEHRRLRCLSVHVDDGRHQLRRPPLLPELRPDLVAADQRVVPCPHVLRVRRLPPDEVVPPLARHALQTQQALPQRSQLSAALLSRAGDRVPRLVRLEVLLQQLGASLELHAPEGRPLVRAARRGWHPFDDGALDDRQIVAARADQHALDLCADPFMPVVEVALSCLIGPL